MVDQPNKPGGDFDTSDGRPRKAEDEQAVKNQGKVSPEDYPEKDGGRASGDDVT